MREGYRKPEITVDGITVVIDTPMQTFYLKGLLDTGLDIRPSSRGDKGYTIYLNREYSKLAYYKGADSVAFDIGHLVKADPLGVSLLYEVPVKDLPASDEQLNPYNAAYEHRIKHDVFPTIKAMGREYSIALSNDELRSIDDSGDIVAWSDFYETADGRLFVIWDRSADKIIHDFEGNKDTSAWEAVIFGREINLDPVGFARRAGLKDDTFLVDTPVRYNQQAAHISYGTGKEIRNANRREQTKNSEIGKPQKKWNKGIGF